MALKHGGINNRRKRKKTKMKRRRHHQKSIAYRRQQSAAARHRGSISASAARSSGENNISIVWRIIAPAWRSQARGSEKSAALGVAAQSIKASPRRWRRLGQHISGAIRKAAGIGGRQQNGEKRRQR
jgi:hypothetical protein